MSLYTLLLAEKHLSSCIHESSQFRIVVSNILFYVLTLRFGPKYRERLRMFEKLDPAHCVMGYERYSEPASFMGFPYVLRDDASGVDGNHPNLAIHGRASRASDEHKWIHSESTSSQSPHFDRLLLGQPSLRGKQTVSVSRQSKCTFSLRWL